MMHTEEDSPRMVSPSSPPPADGAKEEVPAENPPFITAPVPSVNIWQQRKEKIETKPKPSASGIARPPARDSTLWPTLDLAQDEEKKKAQEKLERSEKDRNINGIANSSSKPHGKDKWTVVPYTPTAVFETQISRRGGRPSRGGRDGPARGAAQTSHAATNREKSTNGALMSSSAGTSSPGDSEQLNKSDSTVGKSVAASFKSPKRAAQRGGSQAPREQRKPQSLPAPEKRNEHSDVNAKTGATPHSENSVTSRRTSVSTQTEPNSRYRRDSRSHSRNESNVSQGVSQSYPPPAPQRPERYRANTGDGRTQHPRTPYTERRGDGPNGPVDFSRTNGNHVLNRERPEGRHERGRGGHRGGRGGMNGYTYPQQPPSFPTQPQKPRNLNGYPAPLAKTPSLGSQNGQDAHQQQLQAVNYGSGPNQARNYRGGPRSQSIPNSATFGSFNGYSGSPLSMAPLKTQFGSGYDFQQMPTMSAMPYMPYVEQFSAMSMVSMQLEYYFSVDNLCKDLYLRKYMDSQGFVSLNFISRFNRIQQLTPDIEMVRSACYYSPYIEIRMTSDGTDRVRKREGWEQWVLVMGERDPSAQNEGHSDIQQPYVHQNADDRSPYLPPFGSQSMSPVAPTMQQDLQGNGDPHSGLDKAAPVFVPTSTPSAVTNGDTNFNMNGDINGDLNVDTNEPSQATSHASSPPVTGKSVTQTPLSAAVPDFSPGTAPLLGNGTLSLDSEEQN